jgi:hypothetical protein
VPFIIKKNIILNELKIILKKSIITEIHFYYSTIITSFFIAFFKMSYLIEINLKRFSDGMINIVSLVKEKAKSDRKYLELTHLYSDANLSDREFILKSSKDIKNSEVEMLKQAKKLNMSNFIVEIIADHVGMFEMRLVLEMSNGTMQEYFFDKSSYDLKKIHQNSKNEYKNFLKYMASNFFKEIINFLIKINIVYSDWKFDNILVFFSNNNENNIYKEIKHIKLNDFGSVLKKNVDNINPYFSSPYLSKIFEYITPTHFDDCKAACYLLYVLNGVDLPWKMISLNEATITNEIIKQSLVEITHQKLDNNIFFLKTKDLIYWPSADKLNREKNSIIDEIEIFSCLNINYWT